MFNRLIVMSTCNLEDRINSLFQLTELSKVLKVEYWDVSAVTTNEHVNDLKCFGNISIITIRNKKEFTQNVKKSVNTNSFFLPYMNYYSKTYFCYRILSKYNARIIYCINGCQPTIPRKIVSKKYNLLNSVKNKIVKFLEYTPLLKPADFLLMTCDEAKNGDAYKKSSKTIRVPFNSGDYQSCMIKNDKILNIEENYIVFIDQNYPFHPDSKILGITPVSADIYFKDLNEFFREVEEKYNCKIVIAAHPTAYIYKTHNYFNGRKIFFNKTRLLVKNSIGVISHQSTAIAYPIIYRKPIIIFMTREIKEKLYINYQIGKMTAKLVKASFIDSDNENGLPEYLKVNDDAYNKYKYAYLTNEGTENISNCQILLKLLSNE